MLHVLPAAWHCVLSLVLRLAPPSLLQLAALSEHVRDAQRDNADVVDNPEAVQSQDWPGKGGRRTLWPVGGLAQMPLCNCWTPAGV